MAFAEPYSPGCPTLVMLDRVANRWTMLILARVSAKPLRFNQLRRDLDGVSQKMLSQTLKALERDGLVSRKVAPVQPLSVEYSITRMGATLVNTVSALRDWSDANYQQVLEARERFDDQRWPLPRTDHSISRSTAL